MRTAQAAALSLVILGTCDIARAQPGPPAMFSTIAGRVTDAETGSPLVSVEVDVYDSTGAHVTQATTNEVGYYAILFLLPGTYFARTCNSLGYVDELYDDIPCDPGCTITGGTPIDTSGDSYHVDFGLNGARITGEVTRVGGAPLANVQVRIFSNTGTYMTSAYTSPTGRYATALLAPGSYFASTADTPGYFSGYVNELFDNIPCMPCDVTTGTPIVVAPGVPTIKVSFVLAPPAVSDFDVDGKTDRTVVRPATGVWYSALSRGAATATEWGVESDVDVAADYDGDGATDIAVWRPSTGTWYIVHSRDATVDALVWGMTGDIPLAADIDGDGRADRVIFRPPTGTWFAITASGHTSFFAWGAMGDRPLLGNYNGFGVADFVVFRPDTGMWYFANPNGGNQPPVQWGAAGDVPVVGDWDNDGRADPAVFRPSTGEWFVAQSTGPTLVVTWGGPDDIPIAGDWDGDGRSDFTVWCPASGLWYTQFAAGGAAVVGWGVSGDRPIGRPAGS